jgi:hypothetical protein
LDAGQADGQDQGIVGGGVEFLEDAVGGSWGFSRQKRFHKRPLMPSVEKANLGEDR